MIFETRVDNLSLKDTMEKINFFLSDDRFHQIATINPEFVLEAQKNSAFKKILNQCDLNVADGWGIKLAFTRFRERLRARITGADLMEKILDTAEKKRLKIFLATKKNGLSDWKETRKAILRKYSKLEISGDDIDSKDTNYKIPTGKCQLLFCNFGTPDQEIFINSQKNDKIKLAMGVGGSFDFITGKIKRAPIFIRQIGLEWLWRLILQPKRWKRVFNAVIIFPIKIMLAKR